jgi:NhaP-type Na+/H+ or K+/H+ antiporter
MSDALIVIGIVVIVYGLAAERLGRTVITGPLVFTAIGLAIGPKGADLVELDLDTIAVESVLNTALAVVLFVDATHVKVRALRRGASTPARLLLIGMPAMLAVGFVAGIGIFPDISLVAVAAIATILAPTDAALGQAVISNTRVPMGIRQSLSVESGLNDGLALPVLFTVLAIARAEESTDPWEVLLTNLSEEVGYGILAGVAIGALAVFSIRLAGRMNLAASPSAIGLASIGALAATVGLAQQLHGSLLIGAFVAGLVIGPTLSPVGESAFVFGENLAEVMTLIAFVVFGGVILTSEIDTLTWEIALYAVVTLVVLRPLTVVLAMLGSGNDARTLAFLGWFGPRGLASILFVSTITRDSPDFADLATVTSVMTWTVLFSVVAHGLTAWPGSNLYGDFCAERDAMQENPAMRPLPIDALVTRRASLIGRHTPGHVPDDLAPASGAGDERPD